MSDHFNASRRQLLAGSGAAALAGLVGGIAPFGSAFAKAGAHHTTKLGGLELTVISDGHVNVTLNLLNRAMSAEAMEKVVQTALTAPGQVQFAINVVAIKDGDRITLVDAGSGGNWAQTAGKLAERLEAAGIDPAKVSRVVVTHCHPDHLWGLIDELDDSARFPNAEIVLPKAEAEFWRAADPATLGGSAPASATAAKRILKVIEPKLRLAAAGSEVAPGIAYMATPGHTPGHCSVEIANGSARAIIAADTVFHPLVSFPHPDWQPPSDMDGAVAVASRKRLLDRAASEQLPILAYHLPFPGIGRVERKDGAYRWVV